MTTARRILMGMLIHSIVTAILVKSPFFWPHGSMQGVLATVYFMLATFTTTRDEDETILSSIFTGAMLLAVALQIATTMSAFFSVLS